MSTSTHDLKARAEAISKETLYNRQKIINALPPDERWQVREYLRQIMKPNQKQTNWNR